MAYDAELYPYAIKVGFEPPASYWALDDDDLIDELLEVANVSEAWINHGSGVEISFEHWSEYATALMAVNDVLQTYSERL